MPEIGTSLAVASIIVGLLTIPAASKSLNSSSPASANLSNISLSNMPKEVETQTSSDSFTQKVGTAFKEYSTEIESEEASSSVETPDSRLTVTRNPAETKSVLRSSKGTLKVIESSDSVEENVETPYGTLETVREDGGTSKSFEGSEREKVEDIRMELRDAMERKREQIKERNEKSRAQRLAKTLELKVNEEAPEHVVINNTGRRVVSFDGWELLNNNPEAYQFSGKSLAPGETLKAYSKDKEDLNVTEGDSIYVYGTGLTWENGGDTATLDTGTGYQVLRESY